VPTAIAVTSPDLVLPATTPQSPRALALGHPQLQPLEQALAETSAVLEQHGFLIALYPASTPAPVIRRLHTVRSVLESDRMALVPLELPPLAVAFLARQLAQLSHGDFGPGVLATASRLLTHYIYAGAVVSGVSRLDRIPVSLTSHVKSWLPGAQFTVLAAPRPQLLKTAGEAVPPGPDFAAGMVVARGQLSGDWVTGVLAPAWRVQGVEHVPLPAGSSGWWATHKVAEFAAGITDAQVLGRLVASVQRAQCPWCRLEIIGDRCVVCAARGRPVPVAPAPPPPADAPRAPGLEPAVQQPIRRPPPALNR
jgi:hypothetical protein